MALDPNDRRYLEQVIQALEDSLRREEDPAERIRIEEMLREVQLRLRKAG